MGAKQITHLTFVDIETTALLGPESDADAIVEIAAARVNLKTRETEEHFECLIKPCGTQATISQYPSIPSAWNLGEYHTKAGHFRGADWSKAMNHTLAMEILLDRFLIEGATIAGQNPGFDLRHLQRDFEAMGFFPWPKLDYHVPDLCSPALFLVMAGKVESVSLRSLIPWAYADPNRKQSHRAMGDVKDSIRVFFAMFDFFTRGLAPAPGEGPWA